MRFRHISCSALPLQNVGIPVLRVARTIADLDGAEHIGVEHLSEAIQYRNTDILKG